MRKIFVAIPAYTGDIAVQTMHSLFFAKEEASRLGWEFAPDRIFTRCHDADLPMGRNAFLGWFLKTDCTDLFFVDSDIEFEPWSFTRLFSHGVDFVAGAYRKKKEEESYCIEWLPQKRVIVDEASKKPLVEVQGVGFGMVRLSRALVEKVYAVAPHHFLDILGGADDVPCPWVFESAHVDGQRISEDYTFCRKWRDLGGSVYVDPSIRVNHVGRKTYQGDVLGFIDKQVQDYRMRELKLAHGWGA